MHPPSDPTRWLDIKRLFEAALDYAPSEQEAFLDRACRASGGGPDPALLQAVRTLLEADAGAEKTTRGFLGESPFSLSKVLEELGTEVIRRTLAPEAALARGRAICPHSPHQE